MQHIVDIIGIGMSPDDLSPSRLAIISNADILVGGKRLLDYFNHLDCRLKVIDRDLAGLAAFIVEHMEKQKIVVLASGDPLFFGIGSYLAKALGPEHIAIHPNVSTLAAAFARLKLPWHDAAFVSCHGRRNSTDLLAALENNYKLAVFTDPDHDPAWVARKVMESGREDFRIWVLENLGCSTEKVNRLTLRQAAGMKFGEPNLVVLLRDAGLCPQKTALFGLPDYCFSHQQGLITKSDVRAVSLSRLQLFAGAVVWDLGAGSGAVAIEAARVVGASGRVVAVEKNPARLEQIKANCRLLETANVQPVLAELPNGLTNLPPADRIFVGGGGQKLGRILGAATAGLAPGKVVVVNTVLLGSLKRVVDFFTPQNWQVETIQVQVSCGRHLAGDLRFEPSNPVWIIQAIKKGKK